MYPQFADLLAEKRRDVPAHIDVVDLPDGASVRDVTSEGAVVGVQTDGPADVHLQCSPSPTFSRPSRALPEYAGADSNFTATFELGGLSPEQTHYCRVWALRGRGAAWLYDPPDGAWMGAFTTAPADSE